MVCLVWLLGALVFSKSSKPNQRVRLPLVCFSKSCFCIVHFSQQGRRCCGRLWIDKLEKFTHCHWLCVPVRFFFTPATETAVERLSTAPRWPVRPSQCSSTSPPRLADPSSSCPSQRQRCPPPRRFCSPPLSAPILPIAPPCTRCICQCRPACRLPPQSGGMRAQERRIKPQFHGPTLS